MFEDILDNIGLVYDIYEYLEPDTDEIYDLIDSVFGDSMEDDYV